MKKGIGIIDLSFFLYKGFSAYISKAVPEAMKKDFQGSLTQGLFSQDVDEVADFVVSRFLIDVEMLKGKGYVLDPLLICMDCGKSEFRKKIYPDYKSQRKLQFSEAFQELKNPVFQKTSELIKDLCPSREWVFLQQQGVEADDLIFIACKYLLKGQENYIVASDKDLLQIVDKTTSWITFQDDQSIKEVNLNNFNINSECSKHPAYRNPKEFLEGKYLCGDSGDNIFGIPISDKRRIGAKSAWGLIQKYGSIENILNGVIVDESVKIRGEENILKAVRDKNSIPIIELNKKLMDISYVASNLHLVQKMIDLFNHQLRGE
jgi:5'-3' exonuclease